MSFLYTKHRPSQVREMSDMSPTITRIRDANEFMIAVSVKERIAACLRYSSKAVTDNRNRSSERQRSGTAPGLLGQIHRPGMIKELNAGDEIQVVNPTGQATDAASYTSCSRLSEQDRVSVTKPQAVICQRATTPQPDRASSKMT